MGLDFVYVKGEIQKFAIACGITNDAGALEGPFGGSVKREYDFETKLDAARKTVLEIGGERTEFSIPQLPQTIEEVMARIPSGMGISEKAWYNQVMKEMIEKVDGILFAVRMTDNFKGQMEKAQADKAKQKEYDLNSLAKSNPFGWEPDSQSAKDWADAEWRRKNHLSAADEKSIRITKNNYGL